MPRIISALAIAVALIAAVFILKGRQAPPTTTSLIAEQIQNANQASIDAYQTQLAATASSTTIIVPTASASNAPVTPTTATDKLAQNILESYVAAKQSGVDISDDVSTQLADDALSQSYADSSSPKTYSATSLKISIPYSPITIRNYGNALGAIMATPASPNETFELFTFEAFAESGDATGLSSLSLNIARYQKMISGLLKISVPAPFVQSHINIINSLSAIVFAVQRMQNAATDPVGAINATSDYETAAKSLSSAISAEKALFSGNGVAFSSSEAGSIITK